VRLCFPKRLRQCQGLFVEFEWAPSPGRFQQGHDRTQDKVSGAVQPPLERISLMRISLVHPHCAKNFNVPEDVVDTGVRMTSIRVTYI
jgi:hypothetical protein